MHAKAPDDAPTTPTEDADCPLGARWVSWTLARVVNRRHVSPEECAAVLQARQETGWRAARLLQAAWSIGPGDGTKTPDAPGFLVRRRHAHTTLSIVGQSVHIDWTTGTSYGPLSSYSMVRIYVEGALRNETVQGGSSLGYTVWGDKILAVLDPTTAIRVGPIQFSDPASPEIWLMAPDPELSRVAHRRRSGARRREEATLMAAEGEMDEREAAETIVEFLVDGGSVALTGWRAPDGTWAFEVVADEAARCAFFDEKERERPDALRGPIGPVGTWEEAPRASCGHQQWRTADRRGRLVETARSLRRGHVL